jgi:hypothetical protein
MARERGEREREREAYVVDDADGESDHRHFDHVIDH